MKSFTDDEGREWVATAREEHTPRHHGRWYLVIHPAADETREMAIPEIRWKNHFTAERTLRTMSDFELRRRLRAAVNRHVTPGMQRDDFGEWKAEAPGAKGGTEAG